MERVNGAIALPSTPAEAKEVIAFAFDGECSTTEEPGGALAIRTAEPAPFTPVYPGARVDGPRDAFSAAGNLSLAVGPVWPDEL